MKIKHLFLILAFVLLCAACNSKPPDVETLRLYINASEAYAQGKLSEVIKILQTQNKFTPAVILRAKAEYFSGDLEKAENSCRRALRLRPSSFEAAFYLARILRESGDLAGAMELTEILLTDNSQDIRALRLASEIAYEKERYDEALSFLDRAAEFSAESAMALLDRARLRWIAGKGGQALEDINRAKAMLPWDTPLLRSIINLEKTIKESI